LIKNSGLILRTVKYGDSSLIADIFTETHGLKSFILQGARKSKSPYAPASLQIMAQVQLDYYDNQNGNLHRVKELKLERFWEKIPLDYPRRAIGLFLCEITFLSLHKFQSDAELYLLLSESLDFLDSSDVYLDLHLWYLIQLAHHQGIGIGEYQSLDTEDVQLNESAIASIYSQKLLSEKRKFIFEKIISLGAVKLIDINNLVFNTTERKMILQELIQYFMLHNDRFERLKSINVLQDVFN